MTPNWQQILQQLAGSSQLTLNQLHPHARDFLCKQDRAPWLIACSGGSDSTFLVLALAVLFPERKKDFVIVHYNHKMRGAASQADEQFVQDLAQGLGFKYQLGSSDFEISEKPIYRSEEVLRRARMDFFKKALSHHKAKVLILGHQMNDILETMLMRLSRGSGLSGLIAPRPIHHHPYAILVRPLLSFTRKRIQDILKAINVQWREDSSNQEGSYYRNRLRLEVIPRWLQALADRQQQRDLYACVADTRALLEEDEEALFYALEHCCPKLFDENNLAHLNTVPLKTLPKALARRALYQWFNTLGIAEKVTATPFAQLLESCLEGKMYSVSLSSHAWLKLNKEGILHYFEKPIAEPSEYHYVLPLAQSADITLPDGMQLKMEILESDSTLIDKILSKKVDSRYEAYLSADSLDIELDKVTIRSWNIGDRYQPLGAPGMRKLQDLFVDRKIARCKRHRLPVILLHNLHAIIWVPNFPPAEILKIFPTTKHLLKLTYQTAS